MIPVNKNTLTEIAKLNTTWISVKQQSEEVDRSFYYQISIIFNNGIKINAYLIEDIHTALVSHSLDFSNDHTRLRLNDKQGYLFTSINIDELFLIKYTAVLDRTVSKSDIILCFKKMQNE